MAHGVTPYYYNNKKRGEQDFVTELNGKVLPIEVKSGKDYETHRASSNITECKENSCCTSEKQAATLHQTT